MLGSTFIFVCIGRARFFLYVLLTVSLAMTLKFTHPSATGFSEGRSFVTVSDSMFAIHYENIF